MGGLDGAFRSWGIPGGGTGGVSDAIASAARSHGAEMRCEAPVAHILTRGERITGVALDSGEEIHAGAVLSSVDARRTFVDLLDPQAVEPGFRDEVLRYKFQIGRASCRERV